MPPIRSLAAIALPILLTLAAATDAPRITVRFDAAVSAKPYTGRVFIMTTQRGGEPRRGPSWFGTEPFYSLEVRDWKPDTPLEFDADKALGYPGPLPDLPAGKYRVQAVIDLNGWTHHVVDAPGNGYSDVVTLQHDPAAPAAIDLRISKTVRQRPLEDSDDIKYVKLRSDLLSRFYERDVEIMAAIALPESYADEPNRRYPTVYMIPGFGGTIRDAAGMLRYMGPGFFAAQGLDAAVVFLDPDSPTGHHVFADSANNGPRGESLIRELIPELEKRFRLIAEPRARFVTGHSSGGWSSLWLQVTYPDFFGGVWSLSPDPVDFHAFQTLDIYDPGQNYYTTADGKPRPISRGDMGMVLTCRAFDDMETVVGRGGQIQSFDAVFGPRGPDGRPVQLWDRKTGRLDPKIAEAWKKYDIRLIVESNWPKLGPKLKGKLHLYCGDQDTFHLEGAFFRLRDALQRLGSDAHVEVIPGAGHGLPPTVYQKCAEQMAGKFNGR